MNITLILLIAAAAALYLAIGCSFAVLYLVEAALFDQDPPRRRMMAWLLAWPVLLCGRNSR